MLLKFVIFIISLQFYQLSAQEIIDSNQSINEVEAICIYDFMPPNNEYSCFLSWINVTSPNQILRIVGNHLPDRTDADVIAVYPGTHYRLDFFNGEVFQKFPNLQILRLGTLRGVAPNAFDLCFQLQDIQVSVILETLPNGIFKNCRNLRTFNIQGWQISSLPAELFGTIQSLESFTISRTDLMTLPSTIFQHSVNLNFISLSYNQFESLDSTLFSNLRNLVTIRLNFNRISHQNIVTNLLNGQRNLRNIELYNSGIPSIDFNFFSQFLMLDYLNVRTNQSLTNIAWNTLPESLRRLEISNIGESIPENAFQNLPHLTNLGLYGFGIGNFHQNTFRNLPNLRILNLIECGITELHPELFSSLTQLRHLGLSSNQIQELPAGVFANLTNLGDNNVNHLSLNNNLIRRLNRNAFGVHPNLHQISLDFNEIYEIERGIFSQSFPNLQTLFIARNKCVHDIITGNFDESPELEYCFANWAGETTSTTTTTTDGGNHLKIDLILLFILFVIVFIGNFK
ncbi:hypothetical protein PVAND_015314 [Polypedilum vanderplanki]|uniref:Uncharacterized protein n=1 Tax=Polypedilum vanderplanki TaxID=319348 RepID=A0A9J6BCR0_POLVA|nr:hypothetical protein PVAND_015314 [Polypedilum vanderplanki]